MKNYILFFVMVLFISACNTTATQLHERITNADSVAINYFKGDGTMDTVVAVKIIRDSLSVERLAGFITGSTVEIKNDCGYNGSIHFFKNNFVVQDIFFSSTKNKNGCMQFQFKMNGRQTATELSGDANVFLQAVKY